MSEDRSARILRYRIRAVALSARTVIIAVRDGLKQVFRQSGGDMQTAP